ncbi:hypothetical protein DEDE109153_15165 [Deinococcus deserti]|uniref:hypothetical protein n=1 Tax=Deinococcus deserti TaxID=310783 RepID=UPI0002DF1FCC|nr:hypothetical protein [Deinococcus deserti]
MTYTLRELLTDPGLFSTPLEARPSVEWEEQEWCCECEQYVPELVMDVCLACLEIPSP